MERSRWSLPTCEISIVLDHPTPLICDSKFEWFQHNGQSHLDECQKGWILFYDILEGGYTETHMYILPLYLQKLYNIHFLSFS